MTTIAIIPARGGSVRIPRKNIKIFRGHPIIAYTIETAFNSDMFDQIYVSTEDDEIATVAQNYGAQPIIRDPAYADGITGTQAVAKHVLEQLHDPGIDYACVIYATSPLMAPEDIRRGFKLLLSSRALNFAYSIDGETYEDAGAFYWGHAKAFLNEEPLKDVPTTITVPISSDRVQDINTPDDWRQAQYKFDKLRRSYGNNPRAEVER